MTVTETSEVKRNEKKIGDKNSTEERQSKIEAINDLNNNAALCIRCHTLALSAAIRIVSQAHTSRDCPSDSRAILMLSVRSPPPPPFLFFSLYSVTCRVSLTV